VVSITGATTIRQTVKAVVGASRNIRVKAAGGLDGLNGTLPRRVTRGPLKARSYAHFDDPLSEVALKNFSILPDQVSAHSFLPLLGYQKLSRKIDFSVFSPLINNKSRPIRYASHADSAIYAFYSRKITPLYEAYILRHGLDNTVLAYRSGIGYNVPFAKSLIDEIKSRQNCIVICLDIYGFFDNLNHDKLREALCEVFGTARLSDDWFKIYRRITKYEYVPREELKKKLGKLKGPRLCKIDTFRRAVRPLIEVNSKPEGIPQGTPLSGLFANIYMADFDRRLAQFLSDQGGSYRRYSDDISIVLSGPESETSVMAFIQGLLSQQALNFNDKKTCRTAFYFAGGRQYFTGDKMQYLGFTFDGTKTLIRSESMRAFYSRMKGNIRRYVRAAAKRSIPLATLRKRVLIGRFTHWGDSRNFVQYAYRAAKEMHAPEIKRQLRNHVSIFDSQWSKMLAKYGP